MKYSRFAKCFENLRKMSHIFQIVFGVFLFSIQKCIFDPKTILDPKYYETFCSHFQPV